MSSLDPDIDRQITALWADFDSHPSGVFRARMKAVLQQLPSDLPVVLYERASVHDALDEPEKAVELYRQALAVGLEGHRRRCAVIQLASTLRNLGLPEESVALLDNERDRTGLDARSAELGDAVDAFLALSLVDAGREREAVRVALTALAEHLPEYRRSVAHYAQELSEWQQ